MQTKRTEIIGYMCRSSMRHEADWRYATFGPIEKDIVYRGGSTKTPVPPEEARRSLSTPAQHEAFAI